MAWHRSQFGQRLAISLFLALTILAAYWPTLRHEFVFDDRPYVSENKHVQEGLTPKVVAWAFTSVRAANWHPITWLSHAFDCQLFGLKPAGHHATNIVLHALNSILLFFIFAQITGFTWRSAFIAGLFALHPLHVESVAWVAERKDLLSTFFLLLTIWAYFRYSKSPGIKTYILVVVFFVLGLMSKPMLVTLPFVLLLLDYWPIGRLALSKRSPSIKPSIISKLVVEKIPLFILSFASSIITYRVQQAAGAMGREGELMPIGIRLANAFVSYVAYILKMIWPRALSVLYPHPVRNLSEWQTIAATFILVAITLLAVNAYHKRPYITVGWLWYVGTLVPVIGIVQVGAQAMADRYTYIPLIGLFVIIAWGIPELIGNTATKERMGEKRNEEYRPFAFFIRSALPPVAIFSLFALTLCTRTQVGYWKNALTLFSHAIHVTRGNYLAHNNYGAALEDAGRADEAAAHYQIAIRIRPTYVDALNNMGNAFRRQKKWAEAEHMYRRVLELEPSNAKARISLGAVLKEEGKVDEAIAEYRKLGQAAPDSAAMHNDLGTALSAKGKITEAIQEWKKAIQIDSRCVEAHHNLGIALTDQGKIEEAIEHYRRAIEIAPNHVNANLNLGALLAEQGRHKAAIPYFLKVVKIEPQNAEAHHNLAVSLFLTGKYRQAWNHIHLCQKYGLKPDPRLVRDLSAKMPEPR